MNFIVVLILTIVSFMLISSVIFKFNSSIDEEEVVCQTSVGIRAASAVNIKTDFTETSLKSPLTCKTMDLNFKGDRQEVKESIAKKMARCWWMFHEGRYDQILDENKVMEITLFGTDELTNKCFLCYSLITEEIKGGTISAEEMYDYFRNTQYPKTKERMTYLQYFQQAGGPGVVGLLSNIEPHSSYGITFLAKNKKLESTAGEAAGEIALGAGIIVLSVATGGGILFTVLGVVAGGALAESGVTNLKAQFYEVNRDVSGVFLDDFNTAQNQCFKGDLGGQ